MSAIHCHDGDSRMLPDPIVWRPGFVPESEPPVQSFCGGKHFEPFQTFRTCSYCGSMHPFDFLDALRAGARASVADWKYGWPHKIYVHGIPNPYPDVVVVSEHRSPEDGSEGWICGEPHAMPRQWGKWYNVHLRDLSGSDILGDVVTAIAERTGVLFDVREDRTVRYVVVRP